ncbi:MAG: MBOAT family O-acyltransferase, partial [Anaerolineales bacterium]
MSILETLILVGLCLLVWGAGRGRARVYLLLALSVGVIFWLQPPLPIRNLDFYLPLLTLALTVTGWLLTAPAEQRTWRTMLPALGVMGGVVLLLAGSRIVGLDSYLLPARPPRLEVTLVALGMVMLLLLLAHRLAGGRVALIAAIVVLIALLVVIKSPLLTTQVSQGLRLLTGQAASAAAGLDIRWLGFSYVAFRLIHTLRDRQMGRLPDVSLAEYAVYVLFFPSFTAGPIDRLERFIKDLRQPLRLASADWLDAGQRLAVGLFKKFVVADTLALFALNDRLAAEVAAPGWMWVVVYAYALQIYFDFSGYTDIAIGAARLVGIRLPENFAAPYLKPNLTQFWNAWHMTLTQWFRAYFFNPLTRALRSSSRPLPAWGMILVSQVATMLLIGLWHGISWNFVLWGLWHGLGLFAHNRWSDFTRARAAAWAATPARQSLLAVSGAALNFHFVALGWVFFALSSPGASW